LAKPVVDGIERETASQARVVRLDVNSPQGSELAQHFGVRAIPTVLLLDGAGEVVLEQVGRINRVQVIKAITELKP
jgi:thioredoxin-related protein